MKVISRRQGFHMLQAIPQHISSWWTDKMANLFLYVLGGWEDTLKSLTDSGNQTEGER